VISVYPDDRRAFFEDDAVPRLMTDDRKLTTEN
jgi:hypothetical protein